LIDGIEQEPEGNGAFDVAGGDESRKCNRKACVG